MGQALREATQSTHRGSCRARTSLLELNLSADNVLSRLSNKLCVCRQRRQPAVG